MIAPILMREAARWGLTLKARNGKLVVTPAQLCPPEFLDLLRQHKPELLALLEAKAESLSPDQAPWLHIAKQILAGEWDGADKSTKESLSIGLRSINHVLCQKALQRVRLEPA